MPDTPIQDVSDTAFWVAVYRAKESLRPDALFKDPLADRLAGERGREIEAKMSASRYTGWSLVIRTHIIDQLILEQVAAGVDTVVNLGAGLDTRPYRLDLPATIRWVEVDYPQIIDFKNKKLAGETPRVALERVTMDLADVEKRRQFFSKLNSESKNILVLTEGVTPYLSPEQVSSLAHDLRAQSGFRHWIADYYAPQMKRHMNSKRRQKELKNAPFRFFPEDWFGFFSDLGWKASQVRFMAEEGEKVGRPFPIAWYYRVLMFFIPKEQRRKSLRFAAYVLLEPK